MRASAHPQATPHDGSVRADVAERLSRMIQLETVSAELAERGSGPFEAFVALLEREFPRVHAALERERITDFGLLYRWRGAAAQQPLVLMAHYDVVPATAGGGWAHPPFSGAIDGGFVHGRGALDDKGPLIVVLEAVESLLAQDFSPAHDVYLSFGGNEEVMGAAAQAIAAALHQRGVEPWLILDEGGAVVEAPLPLVTATAAMVGVGEKGLLTLEVTAQSDSGHASAPPAKPAITRLARALARLTPGTFRAHAPTALTTMIGRLSVGSSGPARLGWRALAAAPALCAMVFARLGGEPAALVRTTIAPTMLSAGSAANVLPASASATLNVRIALGETVASTLDAMRTRMRDRTLTIRVIEASDPSPESPIDAAQFELIENAIAASHPHAITVPYPMLAASDARHFHRYWEHVYRFAPLAMPRALRETIHGEGERVAIDELYRGIEFHRSLIMQRGEAHQRQTVVAPANPEQGAP